MYSAPLSLPVAYQLAGATCRAVTNLAVPHSLCLSAVFPTSGGQLQIDAMCMLDCANPFDLSACRVPNHCSQPIGRA